MFAKYFFAVELSQLFINSIVIYRGSSFPPKRKKKRRQSFEEKRIIFHLDDAEIFEDEIKRNICQHAQ